MRRTAGRINLNQSIAGGFGINDRLCHRLFEVGGNPVTHHRVYVPGERASISSIIRNSDGDPLVIVTQQPHIATKLVSPVAEEDAYPTRTESNRDLRLAM